MYRWCVLHLRQAEAGEDGMAKIEAAEAAKRSDVSSGRVWKRFRMARLGWIDMIWYTIFYITHTYIYIHMYDM